MLFDVEREFFLLELSVDNSVLARLSKNFRNTAFGLLEAGTRAADVPRRPSFGCNERKIYRLQTRFRYSGSKN